MKGITAILACVAISVEAAESRHPCVYFRAGDIPALREKAKDVPAEVARCIDLSEDRARELYALLYELLDNQKNRKEILPMKKRILFLCTLAFALCACCLFASAKTFETRTVDHVVYIFYPATEELP